MSVQTFDAPARGEAGFGWLKGVAAFFRAILDARQAQSRFERLWYLSDAELAARGLKRDDIADEVMRAFDRA